MIQSTVLLRSSAVAAACIALNIGLGKVTNLLQLPVFFDTLGTVLSAALVPPTFSVAVGAFSALANSVAINPVYLFFIGTQVTIAVASVVAFRAGWFNRLAGALATGFCIGILAAIVSAPVVAIVFGGVTVPSVTAINALLLAAGKGLWTSVLAGSVIIDSLDKTISGGFVWLILQRLPKRLLYHPVGGVRASQ